MSADAGNGRDREARPDATLPFWIGAWRVDPSLDEIARDGKVVKLEPRKMLLLVTLAARPNQVVTPDELLDAVWPGLVVTQSSIYQSVAQLRKTLGDNPASPEYIATVPRKGYRLIAPVAPIEAAAIRGSIDTPPAEDQSFREQPASRIAPLEAPQPEPMSVVRPSRRRWMIAAGAGFAAAGAGGAWWWFHSPQIVDGIVRIAVLPFIDQTEGGIEQASADGLANDVIHRFERLDHVLVLARNSTFTFRRVTDERAVLRALKQQLDADFALRGELFRTRERIRVAVRLLATDSGRVIWKDVFQKPAARLAELPNLIAAGTLKALGMSEPAPSELNPLEAYELYLLGLNAYQTQRTLEGFEKARDYYQRAIDTDPAYARAYAGVALTWLAQANHSGGVNLREAATRAQPLIDKALTLDPNLLEGLIAQTLLLAYTRWSDGARARAIMQKAVELYPGNAEARFLLGAAYAFDAQPREAIKQYESAVALDPLNFRIHSRWGQDATFLGDFEAARIHFAKAGALMPKNPYRFLGPGMADYARGHLDDAVANYRLQFEQDPRRADAWTELGWLYLDLGMPGEARLAFKKTEEVSNDHAYAAIDRARVAFVEGGVPALELLVRNGALDASAGPQWDIERLLLRAAAGHLPQSDAVGALDRAMRADATPWVGSYWIFLGRFAWIDLALLYRLSGANEAAVPLLDDAQKMLTRLRDNGNVFHTLPFLEARIAALRGQRELAIAKLQAAVDAGWRRAWWIAFDPALRDVRDDARVASLVTRIKKDVDIQRTHVG